MPQSELSFLNKAKSGDVESLRILFDPLFEEAYVQKAFVNGQQIKDDLYGQVLDHVKQNLPQYDTVAKFKKAIASKLPPLLEEKAKLYNTTEKLTRVIAGNALPNVSKNGNDYSINCTEEGCVLKKDMNPNCRSCIKAGFNYSTVSLLVKANIEEKYKKAGLPFFKDEWSKRKALSDIVSTNSTGLKRVFKAIVTDHLSAINSDDSLLTREQYISSLTYFYGIQQQQIDENELSALLGYRWGGKCKDVIARFVNRIHKRLANGYEIDVQLDEKIEDYIEKVWSE